MKKFLLGLVLIFSVFPVKGASPSWEITDRIHLGGEGGWDYQTVDEQARRLYISHAAHVLVLDLKTNQVIASLDATGVHGIALAKDLNRGFISNGGSGTVTIFDLTTLKPIGSVKVGQNPDAICYEPVTKRVFAFNGRSQSASVIDARTGQKVGEIPLPGKPEFAQVDGAGSVFDNIEDKSLVLKIDAAKLTVIAQWSLPAESEPSALAIDPAGHRLFVGCGDQKLIVLNDESGQVVSTIPIGKGVDAAAYDSAHHRVFASCGEGVLNVIEQKSSDLYSSEANIPTEHGARTMAFDSLTGTAYVPSAQFGPPAAPTADHPKPRPSIIPGTFQLLVLRAADHP